MTSNVRDRDLHDRHTDAGQEPTKVVLEPEAAEELVALLADDPGVADEALLDEALEAIEAPHRHLPTEAQSAVAEGELVAMQFESRELDVARTLIEEDRVVDPTSIPRLRDRLRARVGRARRRARRTGRR